MRRRRADTRRAHSDAVMAMASETTVESSATSRLVTNASRTRWSSRASPNHFVVKPPQEISRSSELTELIATMAIGAHRQARIATDTRARPLGRPILT